MIVVDASCSSSKVGQYEDNVIATHALDRIPPMITKKQTGISDEQWRPLAKRLWGRRCGWRRKRRKKV
jgi:hypothetical protein